MNDDSVDDALSVDHERLDELLHSVEAAISSNAATAPGALDRFARGLVHHMAWEDEVLFPAVKGVVGSKERSSIESLEIDHERLRETLGTSNPPWRPGITRTRGNSFDG